MYIVWFVCCLCIYMYIYIYIYVRYIIGITTWEREIRNSRPREVRIHSFGWHYLSNAACLMRPHLFNACFVVPRITIICYIIRRF